MNWRKAFIIASYFATFQLLMPIIGYYLSSGLDYIKKYDNFVAFFFLVILGIGMIKESFEESDKSIDDDVSFKKMLLPSIATSIDALTVGITFSLLEVPLFPAVIIIFIIIERLYKVYYFGNISVCFHPINHLFIIYV